MKNPGQNKNRNKKFDSHKFIVYSFHGWSNRAFIYFFHILLSNIYITYIQIYIYTYNIYIFIYIYILYIGIHNKYIYIYI